MEKKLRKLVANRIKAARVYAGLTQGNLAKKVEINNITISKIENGKRKIDVVELVKLAEILNKPVSYFFDEEIISGSRKYIDVSEFNEIYLQVLLDFVDKLKKKYTKNKK